MFSFNVLDAFVNRLGWESGGCKNPAIFRPILPGSGCACKIKIHAPGWDYDLSRHAPPIAFGVVVKRKIFRAVAQNDI
jgi:hypothetical protein